MSGVDAGPAREASVRLVGETFGADCMPHPTLDPSYGTATIEYIAGDAPAEFRIVAVRYILAGEIISGVMTAGFSPAGSGLLVSGQDLTVEHDKTVGSGANACAYCETYTLEVDVDGPNGVQTLRSATKPYSCPE